jgi:hypothetical protein
MTTPDFSNDVKSADGIVEDEQNEPANDIDNEVEDDANLDVDTPADETDELPADAPATADAKTPAKATTPRVKAPEGYVKPVEFAKILSEHLSKAVPPQVVYSYIKNNTGETARNPFPIHQVDGDGYPWYIVAEEGLAWWDAKNGRVSAAKEARAAKPAKAATAAAAPAETAPVVEAE